MDKTAVRLMCKLVKWVKEDGECTKRLDRTKTMSIGTMCVCVCGRGVFLFIFLSFLTLGMNGSSSSPAKTA